MQMLCYSIRYRGTGALSSTSVSDVAMELQPRENLLENLWEKRMTAAQTGRAVAFVRGEFQLASIQLENTIYIITPDTVTKFQTHIYSERL